MELVDQPGPVRDQVGATLIEQGQRGAEVLTGDGSGIPGQRGHARRGGGVDSHRSCVVHRGTAPAPGRWPCTARPRPVPRGRPAIAPGVGPGRGRSPRPIDGPRTGSPIAAAVGSRPTWRRPAATPERGGWRGPARSLYEFVCGGSIPMMTVTSSDPARRAVGPRTTCRLPAPSTRGAHLCRVRPQPRGRGSSPQVR